MYKALLTSLALIFAMTSAMAGPQGRNRCESDADCTTGYSCCRAVPYPKCFKLPPGAVC
ncbi:hypothetical protein M413DRAFT_447832, partial [Hebeloma cylindrosporum]